MIGFDYLSFRKLLIAVLFCFFTAVDSKAQSNNDAGVANVIVPNIVCDGANDIVVEVVNYGQNVIDSVLVEWTLDGISQQPVMMNTSLDTIGGTGISSIDVLLASHAMVTNGDYEVVAWTSMPNGLPDTVTNNDTASAIYYVGLQGVYTLNAANPTAGSNFQSFGDLSDRLTSNGICGAVVVDVLANSGPYNEQVEFSEIHGASDSNTITINGNGNVLEYSLSQNNSAVLKLNGTDWMTVDGLKIHAVLPFTRRVVHLTGHADHNTFINCEFVTDNSLNSVCVMLTSGNIPTNQGVSGSYNRFENNLIEGGGTNCIILVGAGASNPEIGNELINNEISNWGQTAIYARSQDSLVIKGNDIHRLDITSHQAATALMMTTSVVNAEITENKFHDFYADSAGAHTSFTTHILNTDAINPSASTFNLFANNLIYNIDNSGRFVALRVRNSHHWHIFHNTFHLDFSHPTLSETNVLYCSGIVSGVKFKNNISYVNRLGNGEVRAVNVANGLSSIEAEGNAYFFPNMSNFNVQLATISNTDYRFLSDWQAAANNSYDQNSVFADPDFIDVANDSFIPQNPLLKNIGLDLQTIVPVDIEGLPRPVTPDPGAYQFEAISGPNMAVSAFLEPISGCPGQKDVEVSVINVGLDTVETILLNWRINNVPQTPVLLTDSFYTGNVIDINLGVFVASGTDIYDIEVSIDSIYPGVDIDTTNNKLEKLNYRTALQGTYTIDQTSPPTSSNFTSISSFSDALDEYGICGDVIANVAVGSGPYDEQVVFQHVNGVSDTSAIVLNGNGNSLRFAATSTNNQFTLLISGANYLTIDSLVVEATGSVGWVMWITNAANYNVFKNCTFIAHDQNSLSFSNVVMSASPTSPIALGNNGNHNTFDSNIHIGGRYSISLCGPTTLTGNFAATGNKVINCTIRDFLSYGIYANRQDSLLLDGNDIHRENRQLLQTFYGISIHSQSKSTKIINNKIHDSSTQDTTSNLPSYPITMSPGTGVAGHRTLIANNLIYNMNSQGSIIAMRFSITNYVDIFHNTVVIDEPYSTSNDISRIIDYPLSLNSHSNIYNNIFYLDRLTQNCQFFKTGHLSTSLLDINNNVYFSPHADSMDFGEFGLFQFFPLFEDFQLLGYDNASIFINPIFKGVGSDFYRPTIGAIKSAGQNVLALVDEDIEGIPRTATPDPGVYQFDPEPCIGVYFLEVDTLSQGAELSWQSDSVINEWQVEWGVCGFTPGNQEGTLDSSVTNNQGYVVNGLSKGNCHCIYIREKCDSINYGPWSDPVEICVPIAFDAAMYSVLSPVDLQCGDSVTDVSLVIMNNGSEPITSLGIDVNISGDFTQRVSFAYTGTLLEKEMDTVHVGSINGYWGGNIELTASVHLAGDQQTSNDTIVEHLFIYPFQPNIIDSKYCLGDAGTDLIAMPLPSGRYLWYDVPIGGAPIHIGDTLNVLNNSDTLYVGYEEIDDTLATTLQGGLSCAGGNMFNVTVNESLQVTGFSLLSFSSNASVPVTVYMVQGGYQGTSQSDWTFIESTIATKPGGQQPAYFDLTTPIVLNPGMTYGFYLLYQASYSPGQSTYSDANMTIESGIGLCQPFDYCCSDRIFNGAIHYNNGVCSTIRTPVAPSLMDTIEANFRWDLISHTVSFVSTSLNADSLVWDFAGLGTATGDSVAFQFPATDSFEVCLRAFNKCESDSICRKVWAENVGVDNYYKQYRVLLYPNPSQGAFDLSFDQPYISDVTLRLMDMNGKAIWEELLKNHDGAYHQRFERGDLSSGVYMLQIHNREGTIMRKVVINQ
ncbi:MAG: T9SS type A sorting domain-containing protein [Cryomorphaceae bacterium]|nr:T9SS type A sorting domain-containing protein [Cryomorphaceae bacterium]